MKIIAHRGASSYAPENTLAAYDLAIGLGARELELDLHLTRDGQLAVIHDDRLERTTDGCGLVEEHDRAQLESLDAGSWFDARFAGERIPFFEEVLERYRDGVHLHVEIKGRREGITRAVVGAIRSAGMEDRVSLTSFQRERLEEALEAAPELPRIWLVKEISDEILETSRALKLSEISLRASELDAARVAKIRALGFGVRAWGVKDEELMRRVADLGADGMTVNFPDKLIGLLRGPISP